MRLAGQGSLNGSLQLDNNFYMRDTVIGASGIPLYDHLLSGHDAWLALNYNNPDWGFNAGIRLDAFLNSNLHDRTSAYTAIGVGRIFAGKQVGKLTITGGHIYDQFGSGATFRAYEERGLGIDNALLGLQLKYQLNDNWSVRALAGKQKNLFSTYSPVIKGGAVEGFLKVKEKMTLAPGASVMNRTMDENSMSTIVSIVNSYPEAQRFTPYYNVYAWSVFNTLNVGPVTWYAEYAGKSRDVIANQSLDLISRTGSVLYSTLGYARKGFALTAYGKRTENFTLRTSPLEILTKGMINFLPPVQRQNTYRLLARYNAATQQLGEVAWMLDAIIKPSSKTTVNLNTSHINDLSGNKLFREWYVDVQHRASRNFKILVGAQLLDYNQAVYEVKGDSSLTAISPFIESTIKLDKRKSFKIELQYMNNAEDFGSWAYGLVEFSVSPGWSFALSDMWNVAPKKTVDALHYPVVFVSYTHEANRFALSYVKQVEGIICTGGICRYEPAFSGVKFSVNSNF